MALIVWEPSDDPDFAYQGEHGGAVYRVRLGDYPVEAHYALVVDGQDVDHLDTWPHRWSRP